MSADEQQVDITLALPIDGNLTEYFNDYFAQFKHSLDKKMRRRLKADAIKHIPNVGLRARTDARVRDAANRFYEKVTTQSFSDVARQFPKLVPLVEAHLSPPPAVLGKRNVRVSVMEPTDPVIMRELHARALRGATSMYLRALKSGPVLRVRRHGARHSHLVLMGIYRRVVFDTADVELIDVVVGRVKFVLQRGSVYLGRHTGITPIACTCGDWVNRSHYASVLGCKHMIAVHASLATA